MANVFMPMFAVSLTGISYTWQDKIGIVAPGGRNDAGPLFAAGGTLRQITEESKCGSDEQD